MKEFENDNRCPKCGSWFNNIVYQRYAGEEWLEIKCNNCQYTWKMKCRDDSNE